MRFEKSIFFDLVPHFKIEFSFGDFFLCKNFVISELHEGIHFDWDKILEVIEAIGTYYGEDFEIAYISNRVESYSIDPHLWHRFHKEFNFIIASATVVYNDFGYINASIEKQFANISLKRCGSLVEALNWVKHLKEFNQN
ncbi:hypothetical protein BXY82_2270 [Gelidibacter sediminis]|uniref:SpoIIAA-like protein n=1 Tax=Gelidibacter sediminis TaxID=1608710 RepID=A0A4R7PYX3_9FLAO|nr:hypothetical protein [Gelidibacter sediminis]TDU40224.1 hypothetical protein BXY82_2270 [Gelidibacter sediminis]